MSPRVSRTLPTVEPILLTPRSDPFDDPAWLFEPKFDGYRGLLYVSRQECWFRSKRENVLKRFQELCYWVREELPCAPRDMEEVNYRQDAGAGPKQSQPAPNALRGKVAGTARFDIGADHVWQPQMRRSK